MLVSHRISGFIREENCFLGIELEVEGGAEWMVLEVWLIALNPKI